MNQKKILSYIYYLLIAGAFFHIIYYTYYLQNSTFPGIMLVMGAIYFSLGTEKTNLSKVWNYLFLFFSLSIYVSYFFSSYLVISGWVFLIPWVFLISFLYLLLFLFVKWRTDSKIKKNCENSG